MNKKWYLDENGTRVKRCARCHSPFPYTTENFPSRGAGRYSAYCKTCYKELGRINTQKHKKTSQVRIKNLAFVGEDGQAYKQCTKCGKVFPHTFEYFDPSKLGQGGLHARCRDCRRAHNREIKRTQWQKVLMKNAKMSSYVRELDLNIDEEYLLELWNLQGGKCYWLGIDMVPSEKTKSLLQPSIDRLDSTEGYVRGNIVLCCFMANFGRNENTTDEWKKFLLNLRDHMDLSQWQ